jgi:hypothetical protein
MSNDREEIKIPMPRPPARLFVPCLHDEPGDKVCGMYGERKVYIKS